MQDSSNPLLRGTTVGKVILASRDFYTTNKMYWICVGALFGFSFLFNILFIMALTFLNRKSNLLDSS